MRPPADIGHRGGTIYLLVSRLHWMDSSGLLRELAPTVARLMDRHLATTKEWFPHQHIPYGRGRDYAADEVWCEEAADLGGSSIDDAVRSSLIVNLLTEDNLPYYFRTIERELGDDGPWGEWSKRWTAEEGRHSMVIYGYLMVTRAVDPVQLERSRMHQVSTGSVPEPHAVIDSLAYVAMQELATRIAHRNTGRLLGDSAGYDVMMRVAVDENLHYLFYRDLTQAAIDLEPSEAVQAIERQVVGFEMPGTGIPGFAAHAGAISRAGSTTSRSTTTRSSCPSFSGTGRWSRSPGSTTPLSGRRDRILARLAKSERVARRLTERRAELTGANA